jgi:ribosomal protein S12 methylthiotransferase accessory factor
MQIELSFPGGVAVDASFLGHTVHTDQPVASGGVDTGPSPFDLFLASLATCAGFYALRFCQQRELSTDGLGLTLETHRDPATRALSLTMRLRLPNEFPAKYHEAILRACDQCAVKKALAEPPAIELMLATD